MFIHYAARAAPLAMGGLVYTAVGGDGTLQWGALGALVLVLTWGGTELSKFFKAHLVAMEAQSEALVTLSKAMEDLVSELSTRPCALNTEMLEKFLRSKAKTAVAHAMGSKP